MNFSIYRFTLDLHKHQSQTSVAVFQFDTAIALSIGITDGGLPYYFKDGCKAVLYGKKPSGAPIVHDCKIVDNRIIYTFEKTTADEKGVISCQIVIYNANEKSVSVPTFTLVVGERILNDDEVLDGEDTEGQYSALDALFTSEVERVAAEEARRTNEASRADAEELRVTAEAERVKAEALRVTAEETREKRLANKVDRHTEGLAYELVTIDEVTHCVVSGIGTATDTDIVIPSGHDGRLVTDIWMTAFMGKNINSVIIPEGVATIQSQAFRSCAKLKSVTLPNSLTDIYSGAFKGCSNLKTIMIPKSVTVIGTEAFSNCTNLKIYCEAKTQPKGWNADWNKSNRPVVWGVALDIPSVNDKLFEISENLNEGLDEKVDFVVDLTSNLEEKQTALEERVADLESLTLTYTKDTATAYEKVAPTECGSKVQIKSVGGASEVVKSKNLLNPRDILFSGDGEWSEPHDQDGSITYTAYGPMVGNLYPRDFDLPIGRYYIYVEGGCDNAWHFFEEDEWLEFSLSAEYDEEVFEYVETTRTLKVMLWQDTSVTTDTYEFTEAPEGTVFEPYIEPHFKHANVERIESLGANLIPFPYVDSTKTVNGVTFTVNEDQTITANGTATADAEFLIINHDYADKTDLGRAYFTGCPSGGSAETYYILSINAGYKIIDEKKWGLSNFTKNYMRFKIVIKKGYTAKNLVFKPMLNLGNDAAPYKPYTTEPIDTLIIPESVRSKDGFGFSIDSTYYNYLEVKDGKVFYHKVVEKIVFNGSENYTINVLMSANYGKNAYQVSSGINAIEYAPLCTHFNGAKWGSGLATATNKVFNNSGTLFVFVTDGIQTLDEFKAYLAEQYTNGTPITVLCPLATPTITDVTADFINANPDFATKKGKLLIECGGRTRFVNENEMPVPNTVWYVTRKE